uniref:Uncharacterized protein n=1 Tax=Oryza punctata TaxID=4537 RepID=A0A0E0L955_ORYPU
MSRSTTRRSRSPRLVHPLSLAFFPTARSGERDCERRERSFFVARLEFVSLPWPRRRSHPPPPPRSPSPRGAAADQRVDVGFRVRKCLAKREMMFQC